MARKSIDWDAVGREYRAGMLSVREIARQHGIDDRSIRKHAKKEGWSRDLGEKVRAKVRSEMVRAEVRKPDAPEAEVIEMAAQRGVQVLREHRKDIGRGRKLVEAMFTELEDQTENRALLTELVGSHLEDVGASEQAKRVAQKAISLPGRAGTLRDLTQSLQRLVILERQAFNLDDERPADPFTEFYSKIDGLTKSL